MNNNQFNYMFSKTKRISQDISYNRPRSTICDLTQSIERVQEILEDYQEISNEEIDNVPIGVHVRYISYNKKTNKEIFRFGGVIKKVDPNYIVLIGNNNLTFSVQRFTYNKNNEVIHTTRFFIKDKDVDKINEINQETIKNQEIIDQQNEIIHKQQREIEKLKKKLKQSNNI
jgi:hypothetical protein